MRLVLDLLRLPAECEWLEFKRNQADPEVVGQHISAIANGAALKERPEGYIVWGVVDESRKIAGTDFQPDTQRIGNAPLQIWLASLLSPRLPLEFRDMYIEGKRLVLLRVPAASHTPVRFRDLEYIRVGESTSLLRNFPELERRLWATFDRIPFELRAAASGVTDDQVLTLLDYSSYFDLTGRRLPDNRAAILEELDADRLIRSGPGGYEITNLGALLFGRSLTRFERLGRKAVRVVVYARDDRVEIKRQRAGDRGYATAFENLISFITAQLPENEHIGQALRHTTPMYPEITIRELVANALIHQDLTVTGSGPLIEIFPTRVEVTNPGEPLLPADRFLDLPPRSRNEATASLLRRIGMCEELGSGIDRVLAHVEMFQLPPPSFEAIEGSTRAILLAPRPFADMTREERIRACYQHAGLRYVTGQFMTNATLRERFGIAESNYAQVSRVIADACGANLVRRDPPGDTSRRHARYVPFWA